MKILITTDSACDLPAEILENINVKTSPLNVIIDGKTYKDVLEIGPFEMFDTVERLNKTATTSGVSEYDYSQLFNQLHQEGYEIIQICTSSEVSVSYQNALLASQNIPNVHVIDSKNVSGGTALLVMHAADLLAEGLGADEIVKKLNESKENIETSCVLDTISYVRRGGRISAVAAMGAEVLKLKPCVDVIEGKLKVGKKYRGKLASVIQSYIKDKLSGRTDIDLKRLVIANTLFDKSIIESAKESIRSIVPFMEILAIDAGCAISCHAGPNAFGLMYFRK